MAVRFDLISLLWSVAGRAAFALISVVLFATGGCGRLPHDPEKTSERVRTQHSIRVGVAEDPPWVLRTTGEPTGVEIALIRDFAKSLEATPSWFWGSEQMHMEALKHFELDVVISGLDSNTPWSKQVGLTNPYYDEEIAVGAPLGAEAPGALRKVRIAVAEGNAAAAYLEKKGAIPVRTASLFETPGPVAAPVWELEKRGFRTTKFVLYEKKHVVAVPPGENGWLKTLGDYLEKHKQEVAMLLRREAQP